MAYCAQADIEARISQSVIIALTDDERTATAATTVTAAIALNTSITARLNAAIDDADSEIDGWLRKQYSVPLETTPARIKRCAVDLACYFLHCRRRSEMGIPDDIKGLYSEALKYLQAVNKGDVDLGVEPPPASSAAVVATADGEDRLFTEDTLSEF